MRISPLVSFCCMALIAVADAQKQIYSKILGSGITVGPGNGLTTGIPGDDLVYVTTRDGRVYTIREENGEIANVFTPPAGTGTCRTVVEWNNLNGLRFFGVHAVGNTVYIMDPSGVPLNNVGFTVTDGVITGQPIVKNDIVYVTSNDRGRNEGYVSMYAPFINPPARVFAQQTFVSTQIGPLSKGGNSNVIYFGSSSGIMYSLNVQNQFQPTQGIFGVGNSAINFRQDTRGLPYASNSRLLIATPQGNLLWWNSPIGGPADLTTTLNPAGGSEYGLGVRPQLSRDGSRFYIVTGSGMVVLSANDGSKTIWSRDTNENKLKPILDAGDVIYDVKTTDGSIIERNAKTGSISRGYPFKSSSCNNACKASGYALLTSDDSLVLTIYDNGRLTATRVGENSIPLVFCFSGDVKVQVEGKGVVPMRLLQVGDKVLTAGNAFEPVYTFAHRTESERAEYLQILPSRLELSADHMIFVSGKGAIPASMLEVGDRLSDGARVEGIRKVVRVGAYAPFTASGTITVNNVLASTYISFQESDMLKFGSWKSPFSFQWLAHSFHVPHRIWYHLLGMKGSQIENGFSGLTESSFRATEWFLKQHPLMMFVLFLPLLFVLIVFVAIETMILHPILSVATVVAIVFGSRRLVRSKYGVVMNVSGWK